MSTLLHIFDGAQIRQLPDVHALLTAFLEQGVVTDLYDQEPKELHGLGPIAGELSDQQVHQFYALLNQRPDGTVHACLSRAALKPDVVTHAAIAHLRKQLFMRFSDGQRFFLRLSDTRVLGVLPQVMNPLQWGQFTEPFQSWAYQGRNGKLKVMPMASTFGEGASGGRDWTDQQLAVLLDLTWPDTLLAEVLEVKPDWMAQASHGEHHARVTQVFQAAKKQNKADDLPWQIQRCLELPIATGAEP